VLIGSDFDAGSGGVHSVTRTRTHGEAEDRADVLADAEQIVHGAEASVVADVDREHTKPFG